MRGLRSTVALLVVLAGLGAYIYFVASKKETPATKQDKLFSAVASDNIEELTVKNGRGRNDDAEKGRRQVDDDRAVSHPGVRHGRVRNRQRAGRPRHHARRG